MNETGLFNEWHAKNTSQKVRNVFKNKGMAGIPLTTNPPFGYMKNPENPKEWLIDEPAAKIVRQIFALCVSGLGPTQIAKRLRSEKVLTPTEYWNSIGRNCGNPPARQFNWCSDTVASILSKQEYCGDTVNFRSTTKSFKNKKKIERPQEEWQIFPNTHPAIIDRETFELVQELRQHRRRPTKSGIVSMFSGLLYCADCGEKAGGCPCMRTIQRKPPSGREGGVFSYQAYDQTLQDFCGHFMPPHRTAAIQTAP